MREEACTGEAVLTEPPQVARSGLRVRKVMTRYWGEVIVVAIALLVWVPRLSGPIDLRWDGGVYYLLGTSLATGHSYRIPSEPGSPEAIQYPPLLPAIVAMHQRILGTTDPVIVAPWLRTSYAVIFGAYAVAVLAFARRYLDAGFAVAAAALCLLYAETIFLSDLLYAELPFALLSVLFVLVATGGAASRSWLREIASFALVTTGFLLKTAGVALLAAWVVEALASRRWRLGIMRGGLGLLPIISWQMHVARVRASDEYAHPAYEYQRASYQYYNVSYAENARLVNPFHPELGRADAGALLVRLATNVPRMVAAIGETVSAEKGSWIHLVQKTQRHLFGRVVIPGLAGLTPLLALAALSMVGLVVLAQRRAWLIISFVVGSIALALTTPWRYQFPRYLVPLGAFVAICTVLGISHIRASVPTWKVGPRIRTLLASTPIVLLVLAFTIQVLAAIVMFRERSKDGISAWAWPKNGAETRFFAYDPFWRAWEEAADWIGTNAPLNAIVSTSAPHQLYLHTGRRAVFPPMEADAARARQLLEAVPVSYVIIDELTSLDMSRRYAVPAVESDPGSWRLVYAIAGTTIYERTPVLRDERRELPSKRN